MSIHIIIADDHQLFIDGLKSILSNEIGINIVGEVNNGLELINLLKKKPEVNLIITDIRMPVIDGISATKTISKLNPKIPILALSMFNQTEDIIEMLNAGAMGYISKNVEKKELVKAIHTLHNGNYFFGKNLNFNLENWVRNQKIANNTILTKREKEILHLIAKGKTSIQIASQLNLSKLTIDTHRKHIHQKLNIKSNTGLVNYVLKQKNL